MKILYHTPTATLGEYPRTDDNPVIGLAPEFQVFDVVQEDQPAHNISTHYLQARENIDVPGRKVIRSWDIIAHPSCPHAVPALNLLHVLIDAGLYPIVTSTINGIADPAERLKAQETFRRAATIERQHPLVLLVAQAAGKTSDEIDAYFRQAAQA